MDKEAANDLCNRLREASENVAPGHPEIALYGQAATEIERLQARVAELEAPKDREDKIERIAWLIFSEQTGRADPDDWLYLDGSKRDGYRRVARAVITSLVEK